MTTQQQTRKRGRGRWALRYFEPLNPTERAKRDDDSLRFLGLGEEEG